MNAPTNKESLLSGGGYSTLNPYAVFLQRLLSSIGGLGQLSMPAYMALLAKAERPDCKDTAYAHTTLYIISYLLVNGGKQWETLLSYGRCTQLQKLLEYPTMRWNPSKQLGGLQLQLDVELNLQDIVWAISCMATSYSLTGTLNNPHNSVLRTYAPDSDYYTNIQDFLNIPEVTMESMRNDAFMIRCMLLTTTILVVIYTIPSQVPKLFMNKMDCKSGNLNGALQTTDIRIPLRNKLIKAMVFYAMRIALPIIVIAIVNKAIKVDAPWKLMGLARGVCGIINPCFIDPYTFSLSFFLKLSRDLFDFNGNEKAWHDIGRTLLATTFLLIYFMIAMTIQCTPYSAVLNAMVWGFISSDLIVAKMRQDIEEFRKEFEERVKGLVADLGRHAHGRGQDTPFSSVDKSDVPTGFLNYPPGEECDTLENASRVFRNKEISLNFSMLFLRPELYNDSRFQWFRKHSEKLFLVLSVAAIGLRAYEARPPQASANPNQPTNPPTKLPTAHRADLPLELKISLPGLGGTGERYWEKGCQVQLNNTGLFTGFKEAGSPMIWEELSPYLGAEDRLGEQSIAVADYGGTQICTQDEQYNCL